MTLRICCSILALLVFSELTWAQRHIVPMSPNPQQAVPLVPSAADPSASTAPGVACGFEETTSDGPWILATSTGLIEVQCGTLRRYMGEGSHGQCQPLPDIPGYSEYVSTSSVANNCNGQIRFWKLAENARRAFVAPMSALDNRHVLSFLLRRSNVDFYAKGGGWYDPGWMWFSFKEIDPELEGYEFIDSLTTCTHAYGGSLYPDVVSHHPFYLTLVFGVPPDNAVKDFALSVGPQLAFDTTIAVDLREKENALAHHTDRFKFVENPNRMAVRRAASFQVEVTGENELSENCSLLHFTATHTFDGDPVEIDIPLYEGSVVPPDAWGCRVVHVAGRDPKKLLAEIHIPKDASIGEYTFNAQFRPNGRPEILDEIEFPKKVVVLFNPWGEEDEVYYSESSELDNYVLGRWIQLTRAMKQKAGSVVVTPEKLSWDVDQFEEAVLDVTLGFLDSLTSEQRKSAVAVSGELSANMNAEDDGGLLVGAWPQNNIFPGGASPFSWCSSLPIFDSYRSSGQSVRYAQCWVYAGAFISSLRSLGIPSREVTSVRAGQDSIEPFDGNVTYTRRFVSDKLVVDNSATDQIWDFHVWTEAWMKRADLTLARGWQALDSAALPLARLPIQIGPAAVTRIKDRALGSPFSTNYFVTLTAPQLWVEDWQGDQKRRYSSSAATIGKEIWSWKSDSEERLLLTQQYKNGVPAPLVQQETVASFTIDQAIARGHAISFTSHLANSGDAADTIYLGYTVEQVSLGGYPRNTILSPNGVPHVLAADEEKDVVTTIPWVSLSPWVDIDTQFRITLSAVGSDFEKRAVETVTVSLIDPEVLLNVVPSGTIRFNDLVSFDASCVNAGLTALQNAQMLLRSNGRLRFANNDRMLSVPIGSLAANATGHATGVARAVERGVDAVSVDFSSDQSLSTSSVVYLTVVGCLGDLDGGDSVDDADFSLFAQSYGEFLVPPADPASDLNRDGIVDDADFTLFVQAYDRMMCE